MIVAIASGKGGTGKTTVTASLAAVWPQPVLAVDLDVDEPNLHLFLKPEISEHEVVSLAVPVVDESKCTRCKTCAELCQFKAITVMGSLIMTFPDMCHGCGGCMEVCPSGAISYGKRELGVLEFGQARADISCLSGRLRIGEAMSPPLMRKARIRMHVLAGRSGADILIDAPPGVSCPAMNAVMDSDVIVLVTEPTPFGTYDLGLARQAFAPLGKPMGVVVNRAGVGDDRVYAFCREHGLPILAEFPHSREVAECYARGEVLADVSEEQHRRFAALAERVRAMAGEVQRA